MTVSEEPHIVRQTDALNPIEKIKMDPESYLQKYFGFSEFRGGQRRVVDSLLAGSSALAVFPTGGGKSLFEGGLEVLE